MRSLHAGQESLALIALGGQALVRLQVVLQQRLGLLRVRDAVRQRLLGGRGLRVRALRAGGGVSAIKTSGKSGGGRPDRMIGQAGAGEVDLSV